MPVVDRRRGAAGGDFVAATGRFAPSPPRSWSAAPLFSLFAAVENFSQEENDTVHKNQRLRRLLILFGLAITCASLACGQLTRLQIVNGEENVRRAASKLTTTSTVSAARGEILDRYGRPMVTNTTVFSLALIYSTWEQEGQYERLLDLARRAQADGATLCDTLPISETTPFTFTGEADDNNRVALRKYMEDSKDRLIKQIKEGESATVGENATAEDFLKLMSRYLSLPETFSKNDIRTVVGLYYSMRQVNFSPQVNFTMAKDVSLDFIAYLKEHHQSYNGVEIETEAVRKYNTQLAAHLLGTVGSMWATEWEGDEHGGPYKNKPGYSMNDIVGKDGLELALESYLHGTAGARMVDMDLGSAAMTDHATSYAPQPGHNVVTTIDLNLQEAAEKSLAENVAQYGRGGAAVALDVHTGEVLAMASYPTFDISTYNKNYDILSQDARKPMLNRATSGVYPPGSTFKVLTAIAALEEGCINMGTYFECDGVFEYGPQKFRCRNHEQPITLEVTQAIKYSCNVFFYNVGKILTGERLEKWAEQFGLGKSTGIEIGEVSGHAAGPTYRKKMVDADPTLRDWQGGDDVNAAIGQSDNGFTPLQLANYIATVVNGGTLYQPTLIRSVKSYDYAQTIEEKNPKIVNTVEISDQTRELVLTGMSEVTAEGGTAAQVFGDYTVKVGGKTGSAEMYESGVSYTNGLFVGFAPFDDPEIAVCVVGENAEHGAYVAPVVRDILDVYFHTGQEINAELVTAENTMLP